MIGTNDAGHAIGTNESLAWLDFVRECHTAVEQHRLGTGEPDATRTLVAAAARLETRTARVLALTMLARVAGRLSGANPVIVTAEPHAEGERQAPPMNPRAAAVLAYVEDHHSRSSCRLEDIAQTLRVSRSYLSRLVLRETGSTFNRHLQLARMNTAARLLQASHLSVKEISSATGYEHVPSFDRQFRRHFRMTPGEFRRGIRI